MKSRSIVLIGRGKLKRQSSRRRRDQMRAEVRTVAVLRALWVLVGAALPLGTKGISLSLLHVQTPKLGSQSDIRVSRSTI
ncbi:hypothetical protein CgunFtcFv8_025837 [Champsocephalus gunnari]|uniref:Uncharacterized protein n=1 Tax=Champsocephalus gunnari TaxID=52237 RepID=A0AAN8CCD3_CHAGU|nr:hypothetical protein CgunFtcFv8_025837 [Champsocephalus gunnari]